MTKWYEDQPGVTSSKRIFGAVVMVLGIIMKVAEFVMCLLKKEIIANVAQADSVSTSVLTFGCILLMGTIPENIASNFKKGV